LNLGVEAELFQSVFLPPVADEEVPAGGNDDEFAAGCRASRFRDEKIPVRKTEIMEGSSEAVEPLVRLDHLGRNESGAGRGPKGLARSQVVVRYGLKCQGQDRSSEPRSVKPECT